MGKIIEKNYDMEAKLNKKIVVISDIHYYNKKDMKKLNKVLKKIEFIKPDFICIPGDLIDEAKIYDKDELINWLTNLGKICKVIISYGNHELFITKKHIPTFNEGLMEQIKNINNIKVLDNEVYSNSGINFIGITLPYEYYYKLAEDKDFFIKYFNEKFNRIDNKYNILLCHSPICIATPEVLDKLKIGARLNLVLSGHMHGGITPNFLKKILKGRGLISPRRKLFEKNCYGLNKINKTNFVISSGITVASHLNSFKFLDFFFSSEVSVINFR